MAANITWLGASYSNVPYVTLPKTGGGSARFDDASVTTATAPDVTAGKVFVASDGTVTTGTGSGGGGGANMPTFTVTWYDDWSSIKTVTCDKTYQQCVDYCNANEPVLGAIIEADDESGTSPYTETCNNTAVGADYIRYTPTAAMPEYDLRYNSNGTIQVVMPSALVKTPGTPTATKGAVSNHSVSITPSVTNTAGYIEGGTETGTAVTVSASELVSGSETKTANGTYDVTNLAELVVNVSGGGGSSMNVQVAQSTSRATSSTYTSVISLTCSVAGTYEIYWSCYRSSTSGTSGSQLYVGGNAYGTANTTFTNHVQNNHLTGVTLSKNQTVAVYARSRGSNYYAYVGTLIIKQTA